MKFLEMFRQLFSSPDRKNSDVWIYPQTEEELEEILSYKETPIFIYKHSNICATSLFALKHVQQVINDLKGRAVFCFIEVRKNREISNLVSEKTGVKHESPQVLIFSGGNVLWNASHGEVRTSAIQEVFSQLVS